MTQTLLDFVGQLQRTEGSVLTGNDRVVSTEVGTKLVRKLIPIATKSPAAYSFVSIATTTK